MKINYDITKDSLHEAFGITDQRKDEINVDIWTAEQKMEEQASAGEGWTPAAYIQLMVNTPQSETEAMYVGYNIGRLIEKHISQDNSPLAVLSKVIIDAHKKRNN